MLRHRVDVRAFGLSVPARDARKTVRDVGDLDVERGRVEQVEPAPREHALPGARRRVACDLASRLARHRGQRPASFVQAGCRWHVTRWSLTMPTACMKAYTMVG